MELLLKFGQRLAMIVLILAIGCKPEAEIIPPPSPPIPLVVYPDCSHSFTVAVADTNWMPLPPPIVEPLENYYQDFLVYDISFNPNNPNMMVIAMRGLGGLDQTYQGSVLLVNDLCTGDATVIYQNMDPFKDVLSVDWGENNMILFSTNSGINTVSTIRPNGDSLTIVPYNLFAAENIRWCADMTSFLIVKHSALSSVIGQVSLDGIVLSEDIGFYGSGFDYISEETIGYIGSDVGIFNHTSGTNEVLDPVNVGGNHYDLAYSANDDALIWSVDTLIAMTATQTGLRTTLANGHDPVRYYKGVSASKNGYLAYVTEITSQSLSTPSEWFIRSEIRFINPDGTDERRLVLDFN